MTSVSRTFPAEITEQPATYLESIGNVFARFGADTQDSGNISYGVQIGSDRYFFKTAGLPTDTQAYLDFAARQELLRNAARVAGAVAHPLLPAFHGVIESPEGPVLVYEWRDGEHLGTSHVDRDDPATAFRATDTQYAVLQEAVTTRFPSYSAFYDAWRAAS